MKILKFIQFLKENNLKITDLEKPSKDLKKLKGDVLIDKIKYHEPITINKNNQEKNIEIENVDEIIPKISKRGKYDIEKGRDFFTPNGRNYADDIIGNDNIEYKLNDIKKTDEFGSSGGSSLGTKATRIQECIQCLYLSFRQHEKTNINRLQAFENVLERDIISMTRLPIQITKDYLKSFATDWSLTWIKTANSLYTERKIKSIGGKLDNILDINKIYLFYHLGYKGGILESIYSKYKEFSKINISKWCPADIWAVSIEHERNMIRSINQCSCIKDLNSCIDVFFEKKYLVGISLKKLSNIDEIPDFVINKETEPPRYKFNGLKFSEDPLKTTYMNVLVDRESKIYGEAIETFQIRSKTDSDVTFEVIGNISKQGGISLSHVNKMLKDIDQETIPTKKEILEIDTNELTERMLNYNNRLSNEWRENLIPGENTKEITSRRLVSKYQAILFGILLTENMNKNSILPDYTVSDLLCQKIMYFAMSIKNDEYTSPKYVRFI